MTLVGVSVDESLSKASVNSSLMGSEGGGVWLRIGERLLLAVNSKTNYAISSPIRM